MESNNENDVSIAVSSTVALETETVVDPNFAIGSSTVKTKKI